MNDVLVQKPDEPALYVSCEDIDQCLKVVEQEMITSPVGTRITMLEYHDEAHKEIPRLLAMWHVHETGPRRYHVNPDTMERFMQSARDAYLHGLDREEVITYLMDKRGASQQDAVLASAAGKVLARAACES